MFDLDSVKVVPSTTALPDVKAEGNQDFPSSSTIKHVQQRESLGGRMSKKSDRSATSPAHSNAATARIDRVSSKLSLSAHRKQLLLKVINEAMRDTHSPQSARRHRDLRVKILRN